MIGDLLKNKKLLTIIFVLLISLFSNFEEKSSTTTRDSEINIENTPTVIAPDILSEQDIISITPASEEEEAQPQLVRESARVTSIRDGDTIEVDYGGGNIKVVRYIGIDSPESVDPRKSVQCFGIEASNINKSLVENQVVQLEKDISETDKYGRLLRYVYVGDVFVNKYLVEEGFAQSSTYSPDVKLQDVLNTAENEARSQGKGLWGSCPDLSSMSGESRQNNSSDKDCADFTTHDEAQAYFESKGGSNTNNIDKLDGSDRDGQVCETLP